MICKKKKNVWMEDAIASLTIMYFTKDRSYETRPYSLNHNIIYLL